MTITEQLNSFTDKACMQWNLCPEREVLENEPSCLSGDDCRVVK